MAQESCRESGADDRHRHYSEPEKHDEADWNEKSGSDQNRA